MNNNSQKNFQNKEFEDALENDSEEKENLEYETEEETIASDNDNQSKIEQEQFRAKMLKLFGIVIIGLIIVLGLGFIFSLFSKIRRYRAIFVHKVDNRLSMWISYKPQYLTQNDIFSNISVDECF